MSNAQPRRSAAEASVGNKGAFLAEVHTLDVRRGIKHFLHSRSSFRAFVCYHHDIAAFHFSSEYAFASVFLRIEHLGRAFEVPDRLVHAGRFHHAPVLGYVAEEHCQPAVFRVCVLYVAYAAAGTVGVKRFPRTVLRTHYGSELTTRCASVYAFCFGVEAGCADVVLAYGFAEGSSVHTPCSKVEQPAFCQFSHYTEYSAGAVAVFHRVFLRIGREFAKAWHFAAQAVDVGHFEVHFTFVCHGQ